MSEVSVRCVIPTSLRKDTGVIDRRKVLLVYSCSNFDGNTTDGPSIQLKGTTSPSTVPRTGKSKTVSQLGRRSPSSS